MIENIAFYTMNGDKHPIISEGQEQTIFVFSSASRITGGSELSLPLSVWTLSIFFKQKSAENT